MTYISVDPEGMQTMIDNLNGYAEATGDARSDVTLTNTLNSHHGEVPVDLSTFSTKLDEYKSELESKARGLSYRLEAARAANETGMTVTAPDGTISYYVPDGVADNADNIKAHNNVEVWAQAKADIAAAVDYSENGCTVEEWEALLARMREYQNDPSYANTVTNTIGPAKMLDCVVDIQSQFPSVEYGAADAYSPSLAPNAGEDLAEVFGNILATASHTWDDEKAEHYANRMADATREDGKPERIYALNAMLSASRNADIDGDGAEETVGLDYNDALLTTLAHRLENAKYGSVSKSDSELVDSMYSGDQDINPLSGVVHAMTGNPEASTTWLTVYKDDGSVDAEATAERTKKLVERSSIGENEWTDDWTLVAAQNALLEDFSGNDHVAIVSGIVNGVGGASEKLVLSDAARNATSIALAAYPYGVQLSATSGNEAIMVNETPKIEGVSSQPYIRENALSNMIGQLSEHEPSLTRLGASQEAFNKSQIASTGDDPDLLTSSLKAQSKTRGFIAGAVAEQARSNGADVDERVALWSDIASTAVSAVPIPAAKGGSILVKQAGSYAADAAKGGFAKGSESGVSLLFGGNEDEATRRNLDEKANGQKLNQATTTLAILHSGIYTQEELAEIGRRPGYDSIIDENGTLLVGPDSLPLTPTQIADLAELSPDLPTKNNPGLVGASSDMDTSYESGYDAGARK